MASKKNKVIYIDDEEFVWCANEKDYILHSEFETNNLGEYKVYCVKCSNLLYSSREINYAKGAKERSEFIEQQSKKMLISLGYDFNSQFSIHEQFLIKHNLR